MDIAIKCEFDPDNHQIIRFIETLSKEDNEYFTARWDNIDEHESKAVKLTTNEAKEWIKGNGVAIYYTVPGVLGEAQKLGIFVVP